MINFNEKRINKKPYVPKKNSRHSKVNVVMARESLIRSSRTKSHGAVIKNSFSAAKALKALPGLVASILKLTFLGVAGFLILAIISVLMVLGYMHFSKSDYLMARPETILVKGLLRLTKAEVLAAAGLDRPVNIITLNTSSALNSLTSHPWVNRAELSRSFPDSISLEIVEYKPQAIVNIEQLYYIDESGVAFKKLDPGENPDLPIISGFPIDDLMNRGPLFLEGIGQIFSLMGILSQRSDEFNINNISEIHFDPDRGLTLFSRRGGLEIKVGFGSYTEKFARLGRVMAYLKVKDQLAGLFYINLDCPPRVTVRYKPSLGPSRSQSQRPEV
jgi:cell division protein FtsQ